MFVRPTSAPERQWAWLSLLAGIAVADGLRDAAGVPAVLKWPNDVLVEGRKLAGVLAERVATPTGPGCVVGMGVNVALRQADLPVPTATSLAILRPGVEHPATVVVVAVLTAFESWLHRWQSEGQQRLAEAYLTRCDTIGRRVRVETAGRITAGTAERIDDAGRLVVRTGTGLEVFGAGDVIHLR